MEAKECTGSCGEGNKCLSLRGISAFQQHERDSSPVLFPKRFPGKIFHLPAAERFKAPDVVISNPASNVVPWSSQDTGSDNITLTSNLDGWCPLLCKQIVERSKGRGDDIKHTLTVSKRDAPSCITTETKRTRGRDLLHDRMPCGSSNTLTCCSGRLGPSGLHNPPGSLQTGDHQPKLRWV